jgi:hypothetical protein
LPNVELSIAPATAIQWSWDPAKKVWLVQAFDLRNGGRRVVAECWVLRTDPLPDHQLVGLLQTVIDVWQAGFLF